ncbi:MAG: PsiF repeat-containing protein [Spirochaetae bacterium HGW-Spirochaetae-5]|nr:MAG: PsiF repeat-containing protein [Spirochaetae bacterium HGW-Spirochaetae-5]
MFIFVASVAFAAQATNPGKKAASPAQLAQQEKMKTCNKDAKEKALKGDERKAFMKKCLSGKTSGAPATTTVAPPTATAAPPTQQEKMKACNKDAKDKALKGDERKKFMSDCLKK